MSSIFSTLLLYLHVSAEHLGGGYDPQTLLVNLAASIDIHNAFLLFSQFQFLLLGKGVLVK
jgi:hypothetical protein